MASRLGKDAYYLEIARAVSKRSTCIKRQYGAVIVNNDEIISTGYNGNVRGEANCYDMMSCSRLGEKHNDGLYVGCESVHAEMNAMLSASRAEMLGSTLYLVGYDIVSIDPVVRSEIEAEPCPICLRMIKNAGIKKIVTKSNKTTLFNG